MIETALKALAPSSAKELIRQASRGYGVATSSRRPLPDYLIIGTKRGGTTSLWKNIRSHPQVSPMFPAAENLKSPHYYDIMWERGEAWYRSFFPTARQRRRASRTVGRSTLVGEASPYYLFHPRSADRAALTVPEAKIIIALRNPVERAWSHYRERRDAGTETLDFATALRVESDRLDRAGPRMTADPTHYSAEHDFASYLARGRYLEQIQRWYARFPASSVLVVRSESYYEEPRRVLREVFEFLGLDPGVELPAPAHMNWLQAGQIEARTRAWLADYYRPEVASLESALSRDFDWSL